MNTQSIVESLVLGIVKGFVSVFLVINAIFFIFYVIPGDPARIIAGENAPDEQIQKIRNELGLNAPIRQRYINTIKSLLTLEFGRSLFKQVDIKTLIAQRLKNTLKLTLFTIILVIIESLILFYAYIRFKRFENFIIGLTTFIYSIPNFWLGIILIIILSVKLKMLPMSGYEGIKSLILPSLTLSLSLSVVLSRFLKNSTEQIMNSEFVRFLKSKGVHGLRFYIHITRAVLPTIITVLGLQIGVLMSGTVITENVFSFPGIGSLMIESVLSRDIQTVISSTFVISSIWVILNLTVDIFIKISDPRTRIR